MCSHGYFYQGNEKQTCTTLKNINLVLLQMSHSFNVPYTSHICYGIEPSFFSGEGGGHLFQILSLKRGAYLKLGANSSIYSISK